MINYTFNQLEKIRGLQESIKGIASDIEEKLRSEFGIESVVYTDRNQFEVQLFSYEDVEKVTEKEPKRTERLDADYPYEVYNFVDDIMFFTILTEEEYKKATAPTVTKKK